MSDLPSLAELKAEAKGLRQTAIERGHPITHAQALERIALWYGHRNWNTLAALARRNVPETPVIVGQRVQGRYMGQRFAGVVLGLHKLSQNYRVTLKFDSPVDVVSFESFSCLRQRVTCEIATNGVSPKRRSDGVPHLEVYS